MNKQVKNIYRFFIPIILMFFVFLGLSVINVKAETGFIKNDKGEYEIWDATGFDKFKQEVFNGNNFSGETILLKNNISIYEEKFKKLSQRDKDSILHFIEYFLSK